MSSLRVGQVAGYRLRRRLRKNWGSLVTTALVIALLGGAALGSLVVARETQTSYATIPTLSLVVLAAGALVIANVVAYFPGRSAARTAAAISLRAE